MDFTKFNQFWVLIVVDHFTKFLVATACMSKESKNVVDFLETLYRNYGSPERILSDNGGEFVSDIIEQLQKRNNVRISHGMPYRPQTQGKYLTLVFTIDPKVLLKERIRRSRADYLSRFKIPSGRMLWEILRNSKGF